MNNVTFPLKAQMKGPEVADLQDALRQLLERGAILGDDEGARRELAAALKPEREGQTFGDVTRKLVGVFQKTRRLEPSGAVDAATADALNALLREWGLLDQTNGRTTQVVSGEIRREDGVPMPAVRVRAFHGMDGHAVRLGEDTTDGEGRYTIRYDVLPELRRIDLSVSAVAADGKVLASSNVVRGAKPFEIVDLKVPIAVPTSAQRLEGRVVFEHGLPAEKLTLRLYRRDFGGNATKLSETTTVAGGRYAFAYDSGGKALSLEVRAVDGAGKEMPLSKPVNDLPGDARPALNLAVPAALQPLAPEYKRLTDDVKPLVGADLKKLADAKENAKQQDLTVLNRATGWDARLLACAATAQRLSADGDVGLSNEALYGLLRAGLPSDKLLLAHVAPDVVESALKTVRDAGIVAFNDQAVAQVKQQFTTFANKVRLSVAVPGSKSTYGEMLKASGLNDQDQTKFATAYLGHRGSSADLWDNARKAGLNDVQVGKLQLQGKVSFLTGSSEKLTARIQQALDTSDPAQLAEKDLDRAGS